MGGQRSPRELVKRSFFGKNNCFKFVLYDGGVVMFHFGVESGGEWRWKKVKMSDAELGEILLVLEGRLREASFYHSFGEGDDQRVTRIWVNRKDDSFFIRVKELSKSFNKGEQRVLESLLNHAVLRMNLRV